MDVLCFAAVPSSSNSAQLVVSDPDLGGEEALAADLEVDPLHDETIKPAQHPEPLGDPDQVDTPASEVEDLADIINITTLTNTTCLHDDWMHRGPFLVYIDLQTPTRHTSFAVHGPSRHGSTKLNGPSTFSPSTTSTSSLNHIGSS